MTETYYIVDILILLAAAVVAISVFHRRGLDSVLGYVASESNADRVLADRTAFLCSIEMPARLR
jgi:hypothetical protein